MSPMLSLIKQRIKKRKWFGLKNLAEREGFDPSVQVLARTTV